ncbi:aminotransferase class I/II-fold pyridoxal phosphate-dependent enzyme [Streptomyces sp. NPDC086777]|uniref:aminotransferase class I/II-fold pyridoxal phosphate-dependent enzyme n=1 Tax=Streptomyces sp. NPDC086777 TaxID=3154866 RepID=UPI00344C4ACF
MDQAIAIQGRTSREVAASVEEAVREGRVAPGDLLPSVRSLAARLGLSPATVAAAYRDLRGRGVLTGTVGKGTRISPRPPLVSRVAVPLPEGIRDVSDGNPDPSLLPSLNDVAHALRMPPYRYGDSTMVSGMSELGARVFGEFQLAEEQICLTSGAMDGMERILAAWLRPGDKVVVEDPCYTGVLDLVRAAGLNPVPTLVDDRGLVPGSLRDALAARPAAVILTPRAQNPTGAALDADRADELATVLDSHPDVIVVENDHASSVSGVRYHTLIRSRRHWAVLRSVSKTLGPDLRFAFLAGDHTTVSRVEGRQKLGAGWVSHVLQHMVLGMLCAPETEELMARARDTYTRRREQFIGELAHRGVNGRGTSGLNVMIPVPEEAATLRRLQGLGWVLRAGEPHRLATPPFIRATIATLDSEDITALADAVAGTLRPRSRSHFA